MKTYDIAGKAVLITGASSGIGKALSSCFAEEGARCGMQTTLSDTRRPLRGGFVLEQEGVEYNCDFSALLTARRDELEGEVVAMLFGG